jgi:hypothetical protein
MVNLLNLKEFSHTDSGKKDNATPLFDWGKYYEKNDKILLPFGYL